MNKVRTFIGSVFLSLALLTLPKEYSTLLRMTLEELNLRIKELERSYYRGMN